jgi:hypothetical protein
MKRLAITTLALALTAAAGSAIAYQDGYGYGGNGYSNSAYDNGQTPYDRDHYRNNGPRRDYAQVTRVVPVGGGYGGGYGDQYGNQRQECWNERTNSYDNGYYRDGSGRLYRGDGRSNTNGALLGALVGGALGNQVGKGDGRTAATIAGAVIGGSIGAHAGSRNDGYDQYRDDSGYVRRCRTVGSYDNQSIRGYEVTYRYAGQTYHTVTRYNPGSTIRVVVSVQPEEGVAYTR